MRKFEINQTYCKVLLTIQELNKSNYYPLNEGIFKVLAGAIDEETLAFSNLSTYGTLTSYTSKKICHLTLMLFRQGLIGKIFDPNTKKLYFRISEKGEQAIANYFVKHKKGFAKRNPKNNPTIVKIMG